MSNPYLSALHGHFRDRADRAFCRHIAPNGAETVVLWRDLEAGCRRVTAALTDAGVPAEGEILLFLRHRPDLYSAFFGVMLSGRVPSLMPCTSSRQDTDLYWRAHAMLMQRLRPVGVIADADTFAEMEQAGLDLCGAVTVDIDVIGRSAPGELPTSEAGEDATALLQHSSGTTGLKKGVALSFGAITRQIDAYAKALSVTEQDVIVSWLPLYHDMGLIACLILPAMLAIEIVHLDAFAWVGEPQTLFTAVERYGGTLCWLPNFAFEHLAAIVPRAGLRFDLSSMRAFIDCSEMCRHGSFDRFLSAFGEMGAKTAAPQCCYAMAEAVFAVTQTRLDAPPSRFRAAAGSLGPGDTVRAPGEGEGEVVLLESGAALEGVRLRILDDMRRALPERHVGEIEVAAPFLFDGYQGDPERAASRLSDGRYLTGDLGFLDDGRLYVLGRKDDLLIVNGRNLYAHEIEAELNGVAGLKPGRIVALESFDVRAGSNALVVIAERDPAALADEAAVRREVAARIQTLFAVAPREVRIVGPGWLIKTTSGKISREENLARLRGETSAPKETTTP